MSKITTGRLRLLDPTHSYEFGKDDESTGLRAELKIVSETFYVRLLLGGDLGFAEAYMVGDVVCDDLVSLFKVGKNTICALTLNDLDVRSESG